MVTKDAITIRTTSVRQEGHMKCGILCSVSSLVYHTNTSGEVMEFSGDAKSDSQPEIQVLIPTTNVDIKPSSESISSELPSISQLVLELKCNPCYVLLHRLSPEEIKLYTTGVLSSHLNGQESELLSTSYRLEKKTMQKQKLFEKYKLSRQNYQKRKRVSRKHGTDEFPSETESEDHNSGHLKKKKGRHRRHLTYEDDIEWSPESSKNLYVPSYRTKVNKATKMLRQNARRKIIDSASSDTEDERLCGYDWEEFGCSKGESTTNRAIEGFTSQKSTVSDNSLPGDMGRAESNAQNYDVLTKIIEDMDSQNCRMLKRKLPGRKKTRVDQSNSYINFSPEKRNKRKINVMGGKFVRSSSSSNSVSDVMNDIVSQVCSDTDRNGKVPSSIIPMKVCRSCSTPFSNSLPNEQLCIICKDHIKCNKYPKKKVGKMATNQQKLNKSISKPPKSKVKNRLLKIVPKGDMQRLLYADKTNKLSSEKGYNHCKNITFPKQNSGQTLSILNKPSNQSPSSNTALTKGKGPGSKKNAAEGKKLQMKKKNNQITSKKTKCILMESESNLIKSSTAKNSEPKLEENLPQDKVSFSECRKGLFLMTFPDPDKILDMEGSLSKLSSKKESAVLPKMTSVESKTSITSSIDTTFKSASDSGKSKNCIMSPMPTVVVANYCADDKKGDYHLSSVFYQNDSTTPARPQIVPKPVQLNVVANRPQLSITPVLTKSSLLTPSLQPNLQMTSSYMPTSARPTSVLIHRPVSNITLTAPTPLIINQHNTLVTTANTAGLTNVLPSSIHMQTNLPIQTTLVANCFPDFSTGLTGSLNCNNESELKITNVGTVRNSNLVPDKQFNPSEMYLSAETGEFLPKNITAVSITNHLNSENAVQKDSNSTSKNASDRPFNVVDTPAANLVNAIKVGQTEESSNLKDNIAKSKTGAANAPQISENTQKCSPFSAVYEEIEAIGVLAVIDLEKNPSLMLNMRLEAAKNELQKARNGSSDKITVLEFQFRILENAHKLMRQYGSFKRVSDHFLGKDNLIKIKKEILDEEEEEEDDDDRSSCAFTKSPASFSSPTENSLHTVTQNSFNNTSSPAGPLERLQTQIASINHQVATEIEPSSLLPNYASGSIIGGAAAAMTPRNDFDSRMTPSRGSSGPRTPARPESAASQTEELTPAQIKQEKFDNAISPPSQCAFSLSTTPVSSQAITSQVTNPLNAIASVASMPIMSSSVVSQQVHQQSIQHYRSREIPPNRTAPFDTEQNLARALLTMNPRPPNGNVLNVQQVYLPGNAAFTRNPVSVPSTLNSNNFVLRQNTSSVNVTSGQIVMNNAQMSSQALYPVLSSAANQQVYNTNRQAYNSNQQVYYTPQVSSSLVPSTSSYIVQNKSTSLEVDQMFCAVCNKVATLRCKQCAKVAYCNTICAKSYWHKKHKMECRSTNSEL